LKQLAVRHVKHFEQRVLATENRVLLAAPLLGVDVVNGRVPLELSVVPERNDQLHNGAVQNERHAVVHALIAAVEFVREVKHHLSVVV